MLGSALETRKDIVVTSTQNDLDATFEVATLSQFSEVSYIQFNCGNGGQDNTTIEQDNKASFTCSYAGPGTYEVLFNVYTTAQNTFSYSVEMNAEKSPASRTIPTLLTTVIAVIMAFFYLATH